VSLVDTSASLVDSSVRLVDSRPPFRTMQLSTQHSVLRCVEPPHHVGHLKLVQAQKGGILGNLSRVQCLGIATSETYVSVAGSKIPFASPTSIAVCGLTFIVGVAYATPGVILTPECRSHFRLVVRGKSGNTPRHCVLATAAATLAQFVQGVVCGEHERVKVFAFFIFAVHPREARVREVPVVVSATHRSQAVGWIPVAAAGKVSWGVYTSTHITLYFTTAVG